MVKLGPICGRAQVKCERVGIDMQRQQAKRKIIQPSHLQQFHVSSSHTRKKILQTPEHYKIHCFFPVLDRLISELNRRFSADSCHVMKGVAAINPKHKTFLHQDALQPMARHYGILEDNLSAELHQLKRVIDRKKKWGLSQQHP